MSLINPDNGIKDCIVFERIISGMGEVFLGLIRLEIDGDFAAISVIGGKL